MSDQALASPPSQAVQPLAALAAGQEAVINGFLGGRKLQGRLLALGLFPGQRLTVCQNNGSSLVISLNGNKLVLGRGVSQKILTMPAGRCRRREADCHCSFQEDPSPHS